MGNLAIHDTRQLKPRITVSGVGAAGGNALNNMINAGLQGVDFVVANTDAQALGKARAERTIQMGVTATEGLGAGSRPDVGRAAAEEVIDEIRDHLTGAHMVFVTAGMGGGTGTGASPVVARAARELGILPVGVVTKRSPFEGQRRKSRFANTLANRFGMTVPLCLHPNSSSAGDWYRWATRS
jgi:cell division protein FtsZ